MEIFTTLIMGTLIGLVIWLLLWLSDKMFTKIMSNSPPKSHPIRIMSVILTFMLMRTAIEFNYADELLYRNDAVYTVGTILLLSGMIGLYLYLTEPFTKDKTSV